MIRIFAVLAALLFWVAPASAQNIVSADIVSGCGTITLTAPVPGGAAHQTEDTTGSHCVTAVLTSQYPQGATVLAGNATGSTGAVVGTLAAASSKTTFICGFNVQAIGGTAAVGPITVAGLIGASQVYQGSSSAAGGTVASATFNPCIPASTTNTAITITTTADGTATAVDVNSWGYRF